MADDEQVKQSNSSQDASILSETKEEKGNQSGTYFCCPGVRYEYDEATKSYKVNGSDLPIDVLAQNQSAGNGTQSLESEFRTKINQEVSRFIHKGSIKNVIVLVGAGGSIVNDSDKSGKTLSRLGELAEEKLEELAKPKNSSAGQTQDKEKTTEDEPASKDPADSVGYLNFTELMRLSQYSPSVGSEEGKDPGEAPTGKKVTDASGFNFEDFLSVLKRAEDFVGDGTTEKGKETRRKYKNSVAKICEIIKEKNSFDYDSEAMKHGSLINWASRLVKEPSKATFVTTNYDTMIEDAAENLDFTVIDGFTFSSNPKFDSDMFDWNFVRDVENIVTKEVEYKHNVINLIKVHGSVTWEKKGGEIHRRNKKNIKDAIMIFPSSEKYMASYQEPYYELFAKFQDLLKRKDVLLITTGFSFRDTHIAKMIIDAIKHNKSLVTLVTDHNIDQNHDNWRALEKLIKTHYDVALLKATLNKDLMSILGAENGDN